MSEILTRQILELKQLASTSLIFHHSCESLNDVTDLPVAIECIAIVDLATTNEHFFAINGYKNNQESKRDYHGSQQ